MLSKDEQYSGSGSGYRISRTESVKSMRSPLVAFILWGSVTEHLCNICAFGITCMRLCNCIANFCWEFKCLYLYYKVVFLQTDCALENFIVIKNSFHTLVRNLVLKCVLKLISTWVGGKDDGKYPDTFSTLNMLNHKLLLTLTFVHWIDTVFIIICKYVKNVLHHMSFSHVMTWPDLTFVQLGICDCLFLSKYHWLLRLLSLVNITLHLHGYWPERSIKTHKIGTVGLTCLLIIK